MTVPDAPWTAGDLGGLLGRGLTAPDLVAQLAWLRSPPRGRRLVRPCRLGDGVRQIAEADWPALERACDEAAAAGRLSIFLPASGAASRMFEPFAAARRGAWPSVAEARRRAAAGEPPALDFIRAWDGLRSLPLTRASVERSTGLALDEALASEGDPRPALEALLGAEGLALETLPKGLLAFHEARSGTRTAFAEQLHEAAAWVRDAGGTTRVHATVPPDHRALFAAEARRVEPQLGGRLELVLSTQAASTDTIALDAEGRLARDEAGQTLLRPGGHGALLENLAGTGGDLVAIKNIDNVLPESGRREVIAWRRRLAGLLVLLDRQRHALALDLQTDREGHAASAARRWLADECSLALGDADADPESERRRLQALLARPMRVAGVVRNAGEPGGGPFWVAPEAEATPVPLAEWPQIVESAEVDRDDDGQRAIWNQATHFNPVDMICSLRDPRGRPHDLAAFRDADAVFVARKSHRGSPLLALERPGLWNGGMAGWLTVFVEVPASTFAPVKTVLDLLRDEHRPGGPRAAAEPAP